MAERLMAVCFKHGRKRLPSVELCLTQYSNVFIAVVVDGTFSQMPKEQRGAALANHGADNQGAPVADQHEASAPVYRSMSRTSLVGC